MITPEAVFTACIHQGCSTKNIGLQKNSGIFNRAVYMRFCSEINYYVWMLFFKKLVYRCSIADICLHKAKARILHHRLWCRQITCIGQLIKTDNTIFRILCQHVKYKVTSYKTGAAGYDNVNKNASSGKY